MTLFEKATVKVDNLDKFVSNTYQREKNTFFEASDWFTTYNRGKVFILW